MLLSASNLLSLRRTQQATLELVVRRGRGAISARRLTKGHLHFEVLRLRGDAAGHHGGAEMTIRACHPAGTAGAARPAGPAGTAGAGRAAVAARRAARIAPAAQLQKTHDGEQAQPPHPKPPKTHGFLYFIRGLA